MLWVAASRESLLKLFDTLVDGLHLPFHPVFFRLEGLQGFFLRGQRITWISPAGPPGRQETDATNRIHHPSLFSSLSQGQGLDLRIPMLHLCRSNQDHGRFSDPRP